MASNRTFREPKSAVEERKILENAVPKSTPSLNKWAMKPFSGVAILFTNKRRLIQKTQLQVGEIQSGEVP